MTWDGDESGSETGQPIELFEFSRGGRQKATYTSSEEPVILGRTTYNPKPIKAGAVVTRAAEENTFTIEMPFKEPFFDDFQPVPHPDPLQVIVRRMHLGKEDEAQFWFRGRLLGTKVKRGGTVAEMHFVPWTVDLLREIPRYTFGLMCPYELYGPQCKVDVNATAPDGLHLFRVHRDVSDVESRKITVPLADYDDDWFTGGEIIYKNDHRMIIKHVGNELHLLIPFPRNPVVGDTLDLRAGCGHTTTPCINKFGNVINYGGFPFTRLQNPTLSFLPEIPD